MYGETYLCRVQDALSAGHGGGLGKRDPRQGDQTRGDSTSSGAGTHRPGLGRWSENREGGMGLRHNGKKKGLEVCVFALNVY